MMNPTVFVLLCLVSSTSGAGFYMLRRPSTNSAHDKQQTSFILPPPRFGNVHKTDSSNLAVNDHVNADAMKSSNAVLTNDRTPTTTTEESAVDNVSSQRCVQREHRDLRAHPHDCAAFTMCSAGTQLSFRCPAGAVFHGGSKSCVPKGSVYDTCTRQPSRRVLCPRGAAHQQPHPTQCAQYYHCGRPSQEAGWEDHLQECAYPMLYNAETARCEHYSMVTCGGREEPLDPCDYKANNCLGRGHCVPCSVRHPSCRGKQDGMNAWRGREGSPYYVVCAAQRVVFHGMCTQDQGTQLFDMRTGVCRTQQYRRW